MSVQVRLSNQLVREKEAEAALEQDLLHYRQLRSVLQADITIAEQHEQTKLMELKLRQDECRRMQQVVHQLEDELQKQQTSIDSLQRECLAKQENLVSIDQMKGELETEERHVASDNTLILSRTKRTEVLMQQIKKDMNLVKTKLEKDEVEWHHTAHSSRNSVAELQRISNMRRKLEETLKKKDVEIDALVKEKEGLIKSLEEAENKKTTASRCARVQTRKHTNAYHDSLHTTRQIQKAKAEVDSLHAKLRDSERTCRILEKQLQFNRSNWTTS